MGECWTQIPSFFFPLIFPHFPSFLVNIPFKKGKIHRSTIFFLKDGWIKKWEKNERKKNEQIHFREYSVYKIIFFSQYDMSEIFKLCNLLVRSSFPKSPINSITQMKSKIKCDKSGGYISTYHFIVY